MGNSTVAADADYQLLWSFLSILFLIPRLGWIILQLAFVELPKLAASQFVSLLSVRLNITLKVSSLLLLLAALVALTWTVVRYRYLTKYSRLPPEAPRQEPKMDILVDSDSESERKIGMSSYLDDVGRAKL